MAHSAHRSNGEPDVAELLGWLTELVRDNARRPREAISAQTVWRAAVSNPGMLLEELLEYFELSPHEVGELAQTRSVSDLASLLATKTGKGAWLPPAKASRSKAPPAPIARPAGLPPGDAQDSNAAGDDLESFLIGFVVEQTGYPAEMVELDADLEADLGIDSIKKAQLFGELGERFHLTPDPSLSLDDFPTLLRVLAYLRQRIGAPRAEIDPPSRPATQAPARLAAPQPALEAFEQQSAIAVQESPPQGAASGDLAAFLVNFVVEQTGYPPEMVELDADLEADLGIDSIKKAQLFGELGERFQLAADPDLSLDDFPTLQHVLNYLESRVGAAASQPSNLSPPAAAAPSTRARMEPVTATLPTAATPFDEGFRHGRSAAAEIGARLRRRAAQMDAASASAAVTGLPVLQQLTDDERRELEGIADGAGVLVESLQGLVVDDTVGRIAVEVDLETNAESTKPVGITVACGELEPALVVRRPASGHRSCTVKFPGQLGATAGINDAGVVVAYCSPITAPANELSDPSSTSPALLVQRMSGPGRFCLCCDRAGSRQRMATGVPRSPSPSWAPTASPNWAGPGRASPFRRLDRAVAGAARIKNNGHPRQAVQNSNLRARSGAAPPGMPQRSSRSRPAIDRSRGSIRLVSPKPPSPAAAAERITSRYVIRLSPAAACPPVSRLAALAGHTLIYSAGPLASALAQKLSAGGGRATILPAAGDLSSLLAHCDRLLVTDLPQHLILLSGGPTDATTPAAWQQLQASLILAAFQLCQRWTLAVTKANLQTQATLTAVGGLGGDFGLGCQHIAIAGGALAGLVKGIRTELPALTVRVVDVDPKLDNDRAADLLLREVESRDGELEVAVGPDQRRLVRHAQLPAASDAGCGASHRGRGLGGHGWSAGRDGGRSSRAWAAALDCDCTCWARRRRLPIDPAWLDLPAASLQTLRSETMLQARAQGQDPLAAWKQIEKSLEIERSLRALREAGCQATYHACDIADWSALAATLEKIRSDAGPIRGILHGAGYEQAAKLEKKKLEHVERTIAAKAAGAAALMALTEHDPVRFFLAFGSISGRLGGMGQADYSLANEMLAKQVAAWRGRHPLARATTFHWHAWDEVGMAARPESRFALEAFGMQFMPTAEGTAHVLAELAAGLPEAEVVIAQPQFCPRTIEASAPQVEAAPAEATSPATGSVTASSDGEDQWISMLVGFVVEQTGYPPELVDLDADLEADLGIDSIKKAQLFGEIGERLKLQPSRDLSLDDFPTLRHVLIYLKSLPIAGQSSAQSSGRVPAAERLASQPPQAAAVAATAEPGQRTTSAADRAAKPAVPLSLIDGQVKSENGSYSALALLEAGRDVFLRDHKLRGRPILPAVVGLELMVQTAQAACGTPPTALRVNNFNVHQALQFQENEQRTVRVIARPAGQGCSTSVVSDLVNLKGKVVERDRLLMSADVEFASSPTPVEPFRDAPLPYYPWPYLDDAPDVPRAVAALPQGDVFPARWRLGPADRARSC